MTVQSEGCRVTVTHASTSDVHLSQSLLSGAGGGGEVEFTLYYCVPLPLLTTVPPSVCMIACANVGTTTN